MEEKNYYQKVGKRIKQAREAAGLSQSELGKAVGVSGTAISLYETGDRSISIKLLNIIAGKLNLTLQELAQGYPQKEPDISYALRADKKLRNDPEAQKQILDFIDWVKERSHERRKDKTH